MHRLVLAAAVACLVLMIACAPAEELETSLELSDSQALEQRIAILEAELPDLLERAGIPGLAVAVVRNGETVWAQGFGVRQVAAGEPASELAELNQEVDTGTVFGAASLTKPLFAYLVMKLVDQGVIELDRPLSEYFAYEDIAHDQRAKAITTRMVLSHSTGFPNWRPDRWTDNPKALETQFEPGFRWQYSGEGFIYLQRVVEKVTGQPVAELARDLVFEPLGMTASSFVWEERFADNYAVPHHGDGTPREVWKPDEGLTAGTLQTTANDYARFLEAVLAGEGLGEGTLEAILTPHLEANIGVHWGLGWGIEEGTSGQAIWQWGHDPGYRNFTLSVPDERLGLVFFSNSDNGMLLLRKIVEGTLGGTHHPALDHLDYESLDSPSRVVRLELERTAREEGPEAVRKRYSELRQEHAEGAFSENGLNRLGYRLMGEERLEEAIAIFELNTEAHPEAWNPYDSLGEAYMTRGDTEQAIASYEHSLELNPENGNAVAMLEKLRAE